MVEGDTIIPFITSEYMLALLSLGACASEGYSSWSVCACVCLSGLILLIQGSRATRYYAYAFFTMNARFNMCGVR